MYAVVLHYAPLLMFAIMHRCSCSPLCTVARVLVDSTFTPTLQDDPEIMEDDTEDTADTEALAAATGVFGSGARAASALSARRR
jgi:hypothetical protein